MKKTYTKPLLAVEHYELTQTIASCATKIGFFDSACVLSDPQSTNQMKDFAKIGFFAQSTIADKGSCSMTAQGMDGFDSICYHTNINTAFNS